MHEREKAIMSQRRMSEEHYAKLQTHLGDATDALEAACRAMTLAQEVREGSTVVVHPNATTLHFDQFVSSLDLQHPCPQLEDFGYGFFTELPDSNKPCLTDLAFSDKDKEFCRLVEKFDDKLVLLASSIGTHGMINPILVRPVTNGYQIVLGQRRYLAMAYDANKTKEKPRNDVLVPVIVREMSEAQAIALVLSEGGSLPLNPLSEGLAYKMLRDRIGYSSRQIADAVGVPVQRVFTHIELLGAPGFIKDKLLRGKIKVVKALELMRECNPS
jgi:ParB/RepB/Spo0J family partition protein